MPRFAEQIDCVGCTACASICPVKCIKMLPDKDGFSYPVVTGEGQCLECDCCQQVCPVINNTEINHVSFVHSTSDHKISKDNDVVAYAAFSYDASVRFMSSSGGVFSDIAKYVISEGGVVYGAAYDKDFHVCHYCIKEETELSMIRGAKYAESYLGNVFEEIAERLKMGQIVLFSGTSCQVAGLKSFIRHRFSTLKSEGQEGIQGESWIITNRLICVDFVCHGVPSPMVWQAYIDSQAQKDNKGIRPIHIDLRDKISGWSHYQYSAVFQYSDKQMSVTKSTENPYMKLFIGDYISRSSCSQCLFKGYKRMSDITLGDFWGIWDILPEMDDNKGTSVVLIQTIAGKQIWDAIKSDLRYQEVSLEEASRQNPSMIKSSMSQVKRDAVLNAIRDKGFIAGYNENRYLKKSLADRIKSVIRRIRV